MLVRKQGFVGPFFLNVCENLLIHTTYILHKLCVIQLLSLISFFIFNGIFELLLKHDSMMFQHYIYKKVGETTNISYYFRLTQLDYKFLKFITISISNIQLLLPFLGSIEQNWIDHR